MPPQPQMGPWLARLKCGLLLEKANLIVAMGLCAPGQDYKTSVRA